MKIMNLILTRVVTGFVNINMDIDIYLRIVITNNGHTQSQIIKIEKTKGEEEDPQKNKVSKNVK